MVSFKTFQAVNPPEFQGSVDPVEAKTWLKEIEKAFALGRVGEGQKTEYASYFLKKEANYRWESVKAFEMNPLVSWDRFKELFLEKYFPIFMKGQMEFRFFELKQENMTVADYEKQFTEFSRFVPEYVDTEEKKAKRFQQGLKPWIRSRVAIFELVTYAGVIQKVMIVEAESDHNQKEKVNKKRKFGNMNESESGEPSQKKTKTKPGFQNNKRQNLQKGRE